MSIAEFFILFVGIVCFGCLAVTGWFFITRGEKKVLEDGSIMKKGKIFKNWYFFWMRTREIKGRRKLDTDHVFELYNKIKVDFVVGGVEYKGIMLTFRSNISVEEHFYKYEKLYGVKFEQVQDRTYRPYVEYDDYVFPYWLRDPLAQCATCFSSIYGSIFYWLLIALINENLFAWATNPALAAVFFWITFCFSLSVLNTALAKKFN